MAISSVAHEGDWFAVTLLAMAASTVSLQLYGLVRCPDAVWLVVVSGAASENIVI